MQLKQLTLTNIGPYVGRNTFKLDTTKKRNTILFGGKNGAGKTTLLNSFKIALYGPLTFGYRSASNSYKDKIKGLLNRDIINQSNSYFEIKLCFSVILNFERVEYTIIRNWELKSNDLIEHVKVFNGSFLLNATEQEEFFELLRTEYPPRLLELCLLDGEEILKLTNESLLKDYLKELSHSLFNIDLFSGLESILNTYTQETVNTASEKKLLKDIKLKDFEIDEKQKEENNLNDKIRSIQTEIEAVKQKTDNLNLEFRLHGGLLNEEREQIIERINTFNIKREHISISLKEFVANKLPFYLSNHLLMALVKQLKVEEGHFISQALKEKIQNLPMKNIIESLNMKSTQSLDKDLKNELIKHLVTEQEIQVLHNLSNSEIQNIYNVYSNINQENLDNQIEQIKKSELYLEEINKLRKILRDNEENSEFKEFIERIKKGNQQIRDLENKETLLNYKKEKIERYIDDLLKQRDKDNNKLIQLQRKKSSFKEAEKILTVSKRFKEIQLRRKIKDVEIFALSMLKKLMRKKNFINTVQIDPISFEINIFDQTHNKVNIKSLSAGERQIFILSIIWAMLKSANRSIPIVLDTMFGRLDDEHKLSIVNKLIPEFSKQVIILATNSEITKNLYPDLKHNIANEYTLNYSSEAKRTIVDQGFFRD